MFDKSQIIFWPVGTGDSTSVVVKEDIVLQVDLNQLEISDDNEEDHVSIVDELVNRLPKINNGASAKPHLSGFALTHPDKDHISGFSKLHEKVTIGEIWFTPRIFLESKFDYCDDAVAFRNEALRRVKATADTKGLVKSGDRVRIIGYDDILDKNEFKGFPKELITTPGNSITELDGINYQNEFNAFIHGPFKDDLEGERNETSLAMQIKLKNAEEYGLLLLFGDLSYPIIRKIFDRTIEMKNEQFLEWTVLLAPHHCSKSAMYQMEDEKEVRKEDILDDLERYQIGEGIIVSSSKKVPKISESGDKPPHAVAKYAYQEIANGGFLCTHEDGKPKEPLILVISKAGFIFTGTVALKPVGGDLSEAVERARGTNSPPTQRVTFGHQSN